MLILFNLFLVIGMDMGVIAYLIGFLCLFNTFATILFGVVACFISGAPLWVYAVWFICLMIGVA